MLTGNFSCVTPITSETTSNKSLDYLRATILYTLLN